MEATVLFFVPVQQLSSHIYFCCLCEIPTHAPVLSHVCDCVCVVVCVAVCIPQWQMPPGPSQLMETIANCSIRQSNLANLIFSFVSHPPPPAPPLPQLAYISWPICSAAAGPKWKEKRIRKKSLEKQKREREVGMNIIGNTITQTRQKWLKSDVSGWLATRICFFMTVRTEQNRLDLAFLTLDWDILLFNWTLAKEETHNIV